MSRISATAWSWHTHKFHHLYLNHDVEEKSDQHEQERDYVVLEAPAPPLMPERPPQVTTFRSGSVVEPSVASTRVLVHLGLSVWPVVVHSWNPPNEYGVEILRHLRSMYLQHKLINNDI